MMHISMILDSNEYVYDAYICNPRSLTLMRISSDKRTYKQILGKDLWKCEIMNLRVNQWTAEENIILSVHL